MKYQTKRGRLGLPGLPDLIMIPTRQTLGSACFLPFVLLLMLPFGGQAQGQAGLETELQRTARESPASFEASHRLGEYYLRQKRLREAIPWLVKAGTIDPQNYVNAHDLGLAFLTLGDLTAARRHLEAAAARFGRAELWSLLGEAEEKSGDARAAALAYHKAAQIDPSEGNLLSLGNLLVRASNFDQALQFFDYGLAKYPQSSQLLVGRGLAEYSMGQYEKGVMTLCRAADLVPTDPRPYLFLGEMAGVVPSLTGEIDRRMQTFVKHHPRNAKAHYYRAINLWRGKRDGEEQQLLKEVEESLRRATELDPEFPEPFFELGVICFEKGDLAGALARLKRAVQLKPNHTKAHFRLIQVYQRTGKPALAAREKAIYERLKSKE